MTSTPNITELVNTLRWELGARAGATYARRVARMNGENAEEYARAAEILDRETQEADAKGGK